MHVSSLNPDTICLRLAVPQFLLYRCKNRGPAELSNMPPRAHSQSGDLGPGLCELLSIMRDCILWALLVFSLSLAFTKKTFFSEILSLSCWSLLRQKSPSLWHLVFLFWWHLLILFCSSFSLTPQIKFTRTLVPILSLLSGRGALWSKCSRPLSLSYQPVLRRNP